MELNKKDRKHSFGKLGEQLASKYLSDNGYNILTMNYRVGKLGELDIIASEKEFICFIEVKTRTGLFFGSPSEAVVKKKQERIKRLAWTYLKKFGLTEMNVRFDIVEIIGENKGNNIIVSNINIIKNAF